MREVPYSQGGRRFPARIVERGDNVTLHLPFYKIDNLSKNSDLYKDL